LVFLQTPDSNIDGHGHHGMNGELHGSEPASDQFCSLDGRQRTYYPQVEPTDLARLRGEVVVVDWFVGPLLDDHAPITIECHRGITSKQRSDGRPRKIMAPPVSEP